MPPRRRRRRSDADSADAVRRKINEKEDEIISVFGSVDICKILYGDWRNRTAGNRDERMTKGYKLFQSLKDLRKKLNKLTAANVQQPPPLENFQSTGNNRLGGDSEVTSLRREDRIDDTVNNDLSPAFDLLNFNGNNDDENEGGGIELNSSRIDDAPLRREDRNDDTVNNMIEDRIQSIQNQIDEQEEAIRRDFVSVQRCEMIFNDVRAGRLNDDDDVSMEAYTAYTRLNELYAEFQSAHELRNARNSSRVEGDNDGQILTPLRLGGDDSDNSSRVEGDDGLTEILTPLRLGDDDSDVEIEDLAHDDSNEDLCKCLYDLW